MRLSAEVAGMMRDPLLFLHSDQTGKGEVKNPFSGTQQEQYSLKRSNASDLVGQVCTV